ncbi:MAG: hypothetical protein ACK2UK_22715, partial [Candidatus Promineifilaceae bacterium]
MSQKNAAIAVAKKLSALRATLEDDEQLVLDAMIEGDYSVSAHAMSAAAHTPAVTAGEDEAHAHAMSAAAHTPAVTAGEDEAHAHAMSAA